ncbi:MAG TPA: MaoC family dehydratase [Steroidobacteraceae bacterium]|nr:MaoC family dehydratase [Steroidobacteraceae bacterium]
MRVIANISELDGLTGQEVAVGDWFLIDQQRVDRFAEATNDRQWIHLDQERARRESPFGGTIAHGFLTLSLLPFLVNASLRVDGVRFAVNYGLDKVRFPGPVMVGSRIRPRTVLGACANIAGGVQVEWQVTIEREAQSKPGCIAASLVRYYA